MGTYGAGFTDDRGRFRKIGDHGFKLSKSIFNKSANTTSKLSEHGRKHLNNFAEKNRQRKQHDSDKDIDHAQRLQNESKQNNSNSNPYWQNHQEEKIVGHDPQTNEDLFDDGSRQSTEKREKKEQENRDNAKFDFHNMPDVDDIPDEDYKHESHEPKQKASDAIRDAFEDELKAQGA